MRGTRGRDAGQLLDLQSPAAEATLPDTPDLNRAWGDPALDDPHSTIRTPLPSCAAHFSLTDLDRGEPSPKPTQIISERGSGGGACGRQDCTSTRGARAAE